MLTLKKGIALAAMATALALALVACGDSGGGSASPEKTEYTNGQYGFTLTYVEPLSPVTLTPTEGEEYAIAFADKDGPTVDDLLANGLRVSVIKLDQVIKAKDVPKLEEQIAKVLEGMITDLDGGKVLGKVTATELNGTPGYAVDYQFTQGGEQLTCRLTVLIKGEYEYDLTSQAIAADWDSVTGTLEETVQTFTLD